MLSSDKNVETIAQLIEVLKHYLGLQAEYVKLDMIDKDYRKMLDWDLVIGFAVRANKYVGLDFQINGGFSEMYDCEKVEYDLFNLNSLSASSFMLGLSFYIL